jgi:CBS domain-containing protein
MRKFRENPIHRIWVTDAEHRPVGVIALRDFLWWVLLTAANEYSANE